MFNGLVTPNGDRHVFGVRIHPDIGFMRITNPRHPAFVSVPSQGEGTKGTTTTEGGFCLIAARVIEPGVTLGQYAGVIRPESVPWNPYQLEISGQEGYCIDGEQVYHVFRFMNHWRGINPLGPNVAFHECRRKNKAGYKTAVIVTTKRIMPGEEILVDYNSDDYWLELKAWRNQTLRRVTRLTSGSIKRRKWTK
jgi:hypothetical protein